MAWVLQDIAYPKEGRMAQPPDKPANEPLRIKTLHAYHILDTAPEERFDRITRLARHLFGVPMALISLVDEERQWFKSRQGVSAPQTPRQTSFCGHAILEDALMVVPDALDDVRFYDNPLVTGPPHIRFYAGYPLRVPNGSMLGTLCIADVQPRKLDGHEREILQDLAHIVEREITTMQLAMVDDLTSLPNRRGFVSMATQALQLCLRRRIPAVMLYFDLDGFKEINDSQGHAEGDRVLAAFGSGLQRALRGSDVVGRLGGDEFVAFLVDADGGRSEGMLIRLQQILETMYVELHFRYPIRFSVGMVQLMPERHTAVVQLVEEADAMMYVNKRRSRERTAGTQSMPHALDPK